ncbi:MAG: glycosyltransferase [Azonexus sp.]|nr:glycosyltransferase [Azonexus sp.]
MTSQSEKYRPNISVFMTSTSYPADAQDWRGVFIRHIADALSRRPTLSLRLWAPPGETAPSVLLDLTPGEAKWLKHLMQAGGVAHLMRAGGLSGLTAPFALLWHLNKAYRRNERADVYHINWLQSAIAAPDNGRPILVTALGNDMQLLRFPLVRTLLNRIFKRHPTIICPNAEWMVEPLQNSFGKSARIIPVPFGIAPEWYNIQRQPRKPAIWLVVSRLTARKLGPIFEWAHPHFADGLRKLHVFGPTQEPIDIPDWVTYHGPASPKELLDDWFPVATGLISLSRHAEGRPQVMLEAMAAGLPILASNIEPHRNFISHQSTGWICDSQETFADGLTALEQESSGESIAAAAKAWVSASTGTWDDCAMRYEKMYDQLLNQKQTL